MKLTIAIPTSSGISPQTMLSVFTGVGVLEFPVRLDIITSCYVHDARNKMVDRAVASGSTHLLFVDSDISFPKDAVQKLIAQDKDVIGGMYNRREEGNLPTILMEEGDKLVIPNDPPGKTFPVFATGTGFMLIKLASLEKVEYPYFWFGVHKDRMLGEDAWFCRQVQKAGLTVWCDPNLGIKHIGTKEY